VSRVAWRVTISVGSVGGGAFRSALFKSWRLGKLPDCRIGNTASNDRWSGLCGGAPRRGRANIVVNPIDKLTIADVIANVVGGENFDDAFVNGNSGAIDARAIAGASQFVGPSAQVGVKRRREPAAVFDVQENNRVRSEAFRFGCRCRVAGVEASLFASLGISLHFVGAASAIEGRESEAERLHELMLALPSVAFFAWRRTEPKTGEGEGLSELGEGVIAGVNVAIETEIRGGWRGSWGIGSVRMRLGGGN